MKNITAFLLLVLAVASVTAPTATFAKDYDDDDDKYEYRSDDDSDDDDDDDDRDDDSDDDSDDDDDRDDDDSNDSLEVEADVFTDTTIVKVELRNGQKSTFVTNADTRDEVIDVVADKFNLSESEVSAALDFEIENRASRAKERAKISNQNNVPVEDCDDSSSTSTLQIEADVFTDTTIIKVEKNNTKTVFETDATTTAGVIDAIVDRLDLDADDVEDALDFEVEGRASRASDFTVSSSSSNDDDCDDDDSSNGNSSSNNRDAEIKAKITQLQTLIEALMKLLALRLGNSN